MAKNWLFLISFWAKKIIGKLIIQKQKGQFKKSPQTFNPEGAKSSLPGYRSNVNSTRTSMITPSFRNSNSDKTNKRSKIVISDIKSKIESWIMPNIEIWVNKIKNNLIFTWLFNRICLLGAKNLVLLHKRRIQKEKCKNKDKLLQLMVIKI